jgi:hypothetical protein
MSDFSFIEYEDAMDAGSRQLLTSTSSSNFFDLSTASIHQLHIVGFFDSSDS